MLNTPHLAECLSIVGQRRRSPDRIGNGKNMCSNNWSRLNYLYRQMRNNSNSRWKIKQLYKEKGKLSIRPNRTSVMTSSHLTFPEAILLVGNIEVEDFCQDSQLPTKFELYSPYNNSLQSVLFELFYVVSLNHLTRLQAVLPSFLIF